MAGHGEPPPAAGGYEFEVVEPGPPTYFTPPPPAAARGKLTPAGDGEGHPPRLAPPSGGRRRGRGSEGRKLRTFTAQFRVPGEDGPGFAKVRGHELRYRPGRHAAPGEAASVVEVILHSDAGAISVAVFRLADLLGLFEGTDVDPPPPGK